MIVVDASATLDLLLRTDKFDFVAAATLDSGETLHAPAVLDGEILGGLRRKARIGQIEPERARAALGVLDELPIVQHPPRPLLIRAWGLRENLTAMDALYVVLAEQLDASWVTTDVRAARAAAEQTAIDVIAPGG